MNCSATSTCLRKWGSSVTAASDASPFFAISNAANKASVTLVMAETTTIGRLSDWLEITLNTRSKAATSPTDVPPNFITVGAKLSLKISKSSTVSYGNVKFP